MHSSATPSVDRLDAYERRLADALADRRRVLQYVKRSLKKDWMYELATKHVPAQPYVSRRKRLLVPELERFISGGQQCDFPEILGAYEAVYAWAKGHGRQPDGPPREIYLDGVSRMEIAVPLR